MVRAFCPKAALLLVLILLLAAPVAQAAEPGTGRRPVLSLQDVFAQAWDYFTNLWASNGCGIDPSGRCQGAMTEVDNGCGLDPDGDCPAVTAGADNGCGIDPNGGCGR